MLNVKWNPIGYGLSSIAEIALSWKVIESVKESEIFVSVQN